MVNRDKPLYALGPAGSRMIEQLPFRLDPTEQLLLRDGTLIAPKLERLVFKTLVFLVENAGHLKKKEEIIEAVWGGDPNKGDEGSLQRHIKLIRDALGDDSRSPRYVETEKGAGYRFIGTVEDVSYISDEDCPWVGLTAVDETYADYFCGRDQETEDLIRAVEGANLLFVVGSSGSGKSSLIRAGLVPALRRLGQGNSRRWKIGVFRPTPSPIQRMAEAVLRLGGTSPTKEQTDALALTLQAGPDSLTSYLDSMLVDPATRLLLVIDPFEEVLDPRINDDERYIFFERLLAATSHPSGRVHIVATMRSDMHPKLNNYHEVLWQRTTGHQFGVLPLSGDKLRQAIEGPAQRAGLELDTMLADEILEDLGGRAGSFTAALTHHVRIV